MASKNIAIREDVYQKLLGAKKGGESFSEVIERLLENRSSLIHFSGVLADNPYLKAIKDDIEKIRSEAVIRI
ncbi:MAG: antitoxin VapB family protein [Thaumarchaeota archaeon]|nr:antitoxin VapB family protein [Nitrososphaerota archaeon]